MNKFLSLLVAALFAVASVNALAAKHMAAEKGAKADKKPTAEECKKDPKMKGCEMAKKK
ncbi:hypothetical protein D3C83_78830 [compost metagenome]